MHINKMEVIMKRGFLKKLVIPAMLCIMLLSITSLMAVKTVTTTTETDNDGELSVSKTIHVSNSGTEYFVSNDNEDSDVDEEIAEDTDNIQIKKKSAYMGVYTEELTVSQIRELEYKETFGVLITGVVKNSPSYKYGLIKDDIIMNVGSDKVTDKNAFLKIVSSHNAGDSVTIKVFRLGKEKEIPFVFGSKRTAITVNINSEKSFDEDFSNDSFDEPRKSKKSAGYGGGTWMPIWTMINMDDVNGLLTRLKFNKLDENGILLNGGGGKLPIGNGLFIGGMGAGYTIDRKTIVNILDLSTVDPSDLKSVSRRMIYNNYFWAVTLDKRVPITKNFITSIGFGIGTAGQSIEISQTGDTYNWDILENQLANLNNNYVNLSKSYIIVHPKLELMYRLNSWLAMRAEGGFVYGYSWHNNWKNSVCGDEYEVNGTDINTKYQGYTVSIGPWFGF